MRIIAGRFNRRIISAPEGSGTRPTTDRTRESMFNLIVSRLDLVDTHVLDLFSGSGALGLEAVSRGAKHVDFVEVGSAATSFIRKNISTLDAQISHSIFQEDVFKWLQKSIGSRYSLILADPPYDLESIESLPALVLPLLEENGLFVLEHDRRLSVSNLESCLVSRTYGKSTVSIFANSST